MKNRSARNGTHKLALHYGDFQKRDMRENRLVSVLAYLFFFLPLVICPKSKYGRFHANQSFVLIAFYMIAALIAVVIPVVGPFLVTLITLVYIIVVITGMITAWSMNPRMIPLIGSIKLFQISKYEVDMG